MGTSHGDFVRFPRTPHLFGSTGTSDDEHLNERESRGFLADESLIVEEKIDGTNVGIHFTGAGKLVLQCRGHLITEGMHPQYDLFKQWASATQHDFAALLQDRFIMFGEWLYARRNIHYTRLPHYFLEFDIYDKWEQVFLSRERRLEILGDTAIHSVPKLHSGPVSGFRLEKMIVASKYSREFDSPSSKRGAALMEGLYLRIESGGVVNRRAKFVRPEFVETMQQNTGWRRQAVVPNLLAEGADIWAV